MKPDLAGQTRVLIEDVLAIARERLGMEIGWLSEFEGDDHVFRVVRGDTDRWDLRDGDSMPGADSFCQRMLDGRIPGAIADAQRHDELRALAVTHRLGIRGYIGVPVIMRDGLPFGALCCASHDPRPDVETRDRGMLQVLARVIARDLHLRITEEERRHQEARASAAQALVAALEARDRYTGGHAQAVVELAVRLARLMQLDDEQVAIVEQVALLHDIGKVGIPDSVLLHPGPLDPQQWRLVREHPLIAERIVSGIPELAVLAGPLRAEHENWDGSGYPDGLAGEEIPVASRITLVCDAFHAMTSDRPYRRALELPDALLELQANAGRQFWPDAVEALLADLGAS